MVETLWEDGTVLHTIRNNACGICLFTIIDTVYSLCDIAMYMYNNLKL